MSRLLIIEDSERIAQLLTLRFGGDMLLDHRAEPEIPLVIEDESIMIDRPAGFGKRHHRAQPEVINPNLSRQQCRLFARKHRGSNGVDSRQSVDGG